MHKRASDYAQALNLHCFDDSNKQIEDLATLTDADRMGLWDLIQLDLVYRLINNKPAAISSSLGEWRVNMPWLSVDHTPAKDEAVPVMAFLARSRFTIILVKYFQILEEGLDGTDVPRAVEPLCEEVERVLDEWQIVSAQMVPITGSRLSLGPRLMHDFLGLSPD